MPLKTAVLTLAVALLPLSAGAQGTTPAAGSAADPAAGQISGALHPALSQISATLVDLNIRRWKAPTDVRNATQQDVGSIQRDLSGTLNTLLTQADSAPGSVPAVFAVYRNVDALYDTLLRVVLTADLAAPENEASTLQSALSSLEAARSRLGDSIVNASQNQQAELVRMRNVIAAAEAAARQAPPKTTVIEDGTRKEESATHHHATSHKRTVEKKPPAKTPPARTDNNKPNPQ